MIQFIKNPNSLMGGIAALLFAGGIILGGMSGGENIMSLDLQGIMQLVMIGIGGLGVAIKGKALLPPKK